MNTSSTSRHEMAQHRALAAETVLGKCPVDVVVVVLVFTPSSCLSHCDWFGVVSVAVRSVLVAIIFAPYSYHSTGRPVVGLVFP